MIAGTILGLAWRKWCEQIENQNTSNFSCTFQRIFFPWLPWRSPDWRMPCNKWWILILFEVWFRIFFIGISTANCPQVQFFCTSNFLQPQLCHHDMMHSRINVEGTLNRRHFWGIFDHQNNFVDMKNFPVVFSRPSTPPLPKKMCTDVFALLTGERPVPKVLGTGGGLVNASKTDFVKVHYRGSLYDGTEFATTHETGEPAFLSVAFLLLLSPSELSVFFSFLFCCYFCVWEMKVSHSLSEPTVTVCVCAAHIICHIPDVHFCAFAVNL